MSRFRRPFEILKLIRDGVITNVRDFYTIPDSSFFGYIDRLIEGLEKQGLIQLTEAGEIKPTLLLTNILKTLDISLTQLSNYSEHSIVCSPTFGRASKSASYADVFVVMPFREELTPVYEDHIKKVVNELGLSITRAGKD